MVNVLQAMILTDGPRMVLTPTYHVFEMYVPFQDATSCRGGGLTGIQTGEFGLPAVDVSAARGEDGRVHLALVNLDPDSRAEIAIEIEGAEIAGAAGQILTGPELDTRNTFDDPDTIGPGALTARATRGRLTSSCRRNRWPSLRSTTRPLLGILLALPAYPPAGAATLAGPDGRIELEFGLTDAGAPIYSVRYDGRVVLEEAALGVVREDADFSTDLELLDSTSAETVVDRYELFTSKRRLNVYRAHARSLHLATAAGKQMIVDFSVSDDGIAFRYRFPESSAAVHRLRREVTSFRLPDGARAWLQPAAPAKSGWSSTNPSYEELYLRDIEPGTVAARRAIGCFPRCFAPPDTWLLRQRNGAGPKLLRQPRSPSAWQSPVSTIAFPGRAERL